MPHVLRLVQLWMCVSMVENLITSLILISSIQRCTTSGCLCVASVQAGLQSCVNCALTGNPTQDVIQTAQNLVDSTIHPLPLSFASILNSFFLLHSVSGCVQRVRPQPSYHQGCPYSQHPSCRHSASGHPNPPNYHSARGCN